MLGRVGVGSYAYRWSIGIHDWRPSRPMTPVELVEHAAHHGAELVQIADNMPLTRLSQASLEELTAVASSRGVALEIGTDGASQQNLRHHLSIALELRARLVRVTLNRFDLEQPRDALIAELKEIGDEYADAGVQLAIENHFLLPSRGLATLIEKVGHRSVGVCLDVANSIANGEWPAETIDVLAPYSVNLHLKDFKIDVDAYGVGFRIIGAPVGDGRLDVSRTLAVVEALERSLDVVIEHWIPREHVAGATNETSIEDDWTRRSLSAVSQRVAAMRGRGV